MSAGLDLTLEHALRFVPVDERWTSVIETRGLGDELGDASLTI